MEECTLGRSSASTPARVAGAGRTASGAQQGPGVAHTAVLQLFQKSGNRGTENRGRCTVVRIRAQRSSVTTAEKAALAAALSPLRWKPLCEAIARRVTRSGDSSGARFSEQNRIFSPPSQWCLGALQCLGGRWRKPRCSFVGFCICLSLLLQ